MPDDPRSGPKEPTRREFLRNTGGTAAAAVIAGYAPVSSAAGQGGPPTTDAEGPTIEGAVPVTLRVNGKDRQLRVDPRTTLLDCLRETLLSPEPRRAAITANAAHARCTWTAGA